MPGQVCRLLHDFESGHLQLRVLTPELDELPARLRALGGNLSLAKLEQPRCLLRR